MSWKVEKLAHSKYLLVTIFFFCLFKVYAVPQGRHQKGGIPRPLLPKTLRFPEELELGVVPAHSLPCQRDGSMSFHRTSPQLSLRSSSLQGL